MSRALWQVNRSPLRWAVKTGVSTWHYGAKRQRKRELNGLDVTAAQAAAAKQLDRDGYAIVSELIDPYLLHELAAAGEAKLSEIDAADKQQAGYWKKFLVHLLDSEMVDGKLAADNLFVRYALQPGVVNVVASALGEVPWLDYVMLSYSRHTGEALASSQLWHRDHDDVRVVKFYTYLTDVKEDADGPFTFLPRQSTERFGYPLLGSHFRDDEVFEKVPRQDVKVMKAPRLVSFIVDTGRCLHMGSRIAPGHGRLMYTATFIAFPRMFPGGKKRPFRATPGMSDLDKMILGLG
ncbi:phytanoyl-CoA dioxygenase family protein [Bradyrhizobium sp. IC3195]|uniref:phytanoyl-CoA dioxygenase family protein n=1 Tax=Bradyrhizobium sp. IC3195 TaxID=2793804 RepID=UPI001CD7DDBC|nr:phytanoyl-CoA dioxygenase family protein [Bradyrhizobium sp. IC3195]